MDSVEYGVMKMSRTKSPYGYPRLLWDILFECEQRKETITVQAPSRQLGFDLRRQVYSFRASLMHEAERMRKLGQLDDYALWMNKYRAVQAYLVQVTDSNHGGTINLIHQDTSGGAIIATGRALTVDDVIERTDMDRAENAPIAPLQTLHEFAAAAQQRQEDVFAKLGYAPIPGGGLSEATKKAIAAADAREAEATRQASESASNEPLPAPPSGSNDKP